MSMVKMLAMMMMMMMMKIYNHDDDDDGDNSNCNGQHCFDGLESRIWAGASIAKWDCL